MSGLLSKAQSSTKRTLGFSDDRRTPSDGWVSELYDGKSAWCRGEIHRRPSSSSLFVPDESHEPLPPMHDGQNDVLPLPPRREPLERKEFLVHLLWKSSSTRKSSESSEKSCDEGQNTERNQTHLAIRTLLS